MIFLKEQYCPDIRCRSTCSVIQLISNDRHMTTRASTVDDNVAPGHRESIINCIICIESLLRLTSIASRYIVGCLKDKQNWLVFWSRKEGNCLLRHNIDVLRPSKGAFYRKALFVLLLLIANHYKEICTWVLLLLRLFSEATFNWPYNNWTR